MERKDDCQKIGLKDQNGLITGGRIVGDVPAGFGDTISACRRLLG